MGRKSILPDYRESFFVVKETGYGALIHRFAVSPQSRMQLRLIIALSRTWVKRMAFGLRTLSIMVCVTTGAPKRNTTYTVHNLQTGPNVM